jgi:hypothetical protein
MSQKTGAAPTAAMAWKSATLLKDGVITSSPGPTPAAIRARWSAACPVLTATTCRSEAPTTSFSRSSKRPT